MKMLRILHIGKFYPPHMGGIETHLQDLVSGLSNRAEVQVLVSADSSHRTVECKDGARIVRIPKFGTVASMPITPSLFWEFRRICADIVHVHTPNPFAACAVVASGYHGPLVVTHHSDTLGRTYLRHLSDPFVNEMMRRADCIITTSARYAAASPELAPFLDKCVTIPLGIHFASTDKDDESEVTRVAREFGPDFVLALGRLVPYKGFECLIEAMKNVRTRLVIIGTGPLEHELRKHAGRCGVEERVMLIGRVNDVLPYYKASALFVLPSISRAEAFGVVQMEAMAAGLPVINTNLDSGVPKFLLTEKQGLPFRRTTRSLLDGRSIFCSTTQKCGSAWDRQQGIERWRISLQIK